MNMFKVNYSIEAAKTLKNIPKNIANQIIKKINTLAEDPYKTNTNIKPLKGTNALRLRVGDWRIIYEIENQQLLIYIIGILPRSKAYK